MMEGTKYYNRHLIKALGKALGLLFLFSLQPALFAFLIWLIVLSPIPMIP